MIAGANLKEDSLLLRIDILRSQIETALKEAPVSVAPPSLWRSYAPQYTSVLNLARDELLRVRVHAGIFGNDRLFLKSDPVSFVRYNNFHFYRHAISENLWATEPKIFGIEELPGVPWRGLTINSDVIRHMRAISNCVTSGALAAVSRQKTRRPVVVEIGGGYGGLAYSLWPALPKGVLYIIVDLPEILLMAGAYLIANRPSLRVKVWSGEAKESNFDIDTLNTDVLLVPDYAAELLEGLPGIDLALCVQSFALMGSSEVSGYAKLLGKKLNGWLYSDNLERHPDSVDPQKQLVSSALACEMTLFPDSAVFEREFRASNLPYFNRPYIGGRFSRPPPAGWMKAIDAPGLLAGQAMRIDLWPSCAQRVESENITPHPLAGSSSTERRAMIYGTGSMVLRASDLLKSASVPVSAVLSDQPVGTSVGGIVVRPIGDINRIEPPETNVMVVVTPSPHSALGTLESAQAFREVQHRMRNEHRFFGPILHIAALAPIYEMPKIGPALLFGCQGAGNTVIWNIIKHLRESVEAKVVQTDFDMHKAVLEYDSMVRWVIDEAFNALGRSQGVYSEGHLGYREAAIKLGTSGEIVIHNIPSQKWRFEDTFRHAFIYSSELAEIRRSRAKLIIPVRHPFDVLVSIAAKDDQSTERPHTLLGDLGYFENRVSYVRRHMTHALTLAPHATVVRYEDVLTDPKNSIQRIAESLGCYLGPGDQDKIWERIGHRPLTSDARHYWRGGINGWERYLKRDHLKILSRYRMNELAVAWGYESIELPEISNNEFVPESFSMAPFAQGPAGADGRALFVAGSDSRIVDSANWLLGRADVQSVLRAGRL